MVRENCWEYMGCGREAGGDRVHEFGVCPAYNIDKYNGFNAGRNGGRYCWMVEGTLCQNTIQGNWAQKMRHCLTKCEFFKHVQAQQGGSLKY
ncbi:MAG: hypothetical protein GF403_09425 [Candidatus Coatesbacteria bacterium]|nr:hypothetical protein [Candidatus Coatesbacteria bacterium]